MKHPVGRFFGLLFLCAAFSAGCAGSRRNDPTVILRSQRVQATMVEIGSALDQFRTDHGDYPEGIAPLREGRYFSIMPDLERDWTFSFDVDGGKIMTIEAVSQEAMVDGPGYKIFFRVPDNYWEGYGITVWPR